MSGEDVKVLKEGVGKLEEKFDKLGTKLDTVVEAIADLRVLVAGNYVTKADFTDYQKIEEARVVAIHKKIDNTDGKISNHQKEEWEDRLKIAGLVLVVCSFVFGVIQFLV